MREEANQMLKDKLFLVMLMSGLLTIVAATGVVAVQRGKGNETNPCLEMPQPEVIAQEIVSGMPQAADASDATKETQRGEPTPIKVAVAQNANQGDDLAAEAGAGEDAADALVLNFMDTSRMEWPVGGNVLLDYSMDQIVHFPILDQYKCNPELVVQSGVSTPVGTPANARILEVGPSKGTGNYVIMDLGNEYVATCGQLKEVCVAEGEYLKKGQILGYVSEPVKYYSVKDVNVSFELKHQNKTVDPLDYMEQGPENCR